MHQLRCLRPAVGTHAGCLAPVNENSWFLNTMGGCDMSISTPLNTSFCHLTSTATVPISQLRCIKL